MAGTRKELGPTGRRLASALRRIRRGETQDITTAEMSRRLTALGQPIPDTGITKTEQGTRRVDVDDLVAISLALGVTPNTLLLPQPGYLDGAEWHQLTPEAGGSPEQLWQWAQGEMPPVILAPDGQSWLGGGDHPMAAFAIRNRPYLTAPRPPAAEDDGTEVALRGLASAVAEALHAGAPSTEVRRVVELTIALPVIAVTPEFRQRLARGPRPDGEGS